MLAVSFLGVACENPGKKIKKQSEAELKKIEQINKNNAEVLRKAGLRCDVFVAIGVSKEGDLMTGSSLLTHPNMSSLSDEGNVVGVFGEFTFDLKSMNGPIFKGLILQNEDGTVVESEA